MERVLKVVMLVEGIYDFNEDIKIRIFGLPTLRRRLEIFFLTSRLGDVSEGNMGERSAASEPSNRC